MPKSKRSRQIRSRPPLEPMMRIHHLIGNGEYPNCTAVAKELEVSTRTIKLDVEFMEYRWTCPTSTTPAGTASTTPSRSNNSPAGR